MGVTLEQLAQTATCGETRAVEGLVESVQHEAARAAKASAALKASEWKAWATKAAEGAGGKAHAFSRGPAATGSDPLLGGLPAAGQGLIEALLADWQPLWSDPTRTRESKAILNYDVQSTLGPITLLELDEVLLTYQSKVGLGADCLHPR